MSLFQTTRWSLVRRACASNPLAARAALADLFSHYWQPLYYFLRRRGKQPDDAADSVQGYFTHLLEKAAIEKADPERGRFRTFLLSTLQNYLGHEVEKAQTLKRGGSKIIESLDFVSAEQCYQREPADTSTPERLFERQYALKLLEQTMTALHAEYLERGKNTQWQALHPYLTGDGNTAYSTLATQMQVSESAIKVAIHRMRERFGVILRQTILQTVAEEDEVEEELRWLMESVRG